MRNLCLSVLLFAWMAGSPAVGETVHTGKVTGIVDGDTLFVTPDLEDSGEIRLVGIQAPKLPLGRKNFKTWPFAKEAKQALADMTLGKSLGLSFGGARRDRYGRWLAHLHVIEGAAPGLWVQGEMLRLGMARVYSFPDNRALVEDMLALERDARANGRGIWSNSFYHILNPNIDVLSQKLGTFQLIEGRILDAAKVKGMVYLNFGADWRTDFTISIARDALKLFEADGVDPLTLLGESVRVRGWLIKRNGPMIRTTHPEQIELLGR
tara:strand:- start:189511 stop:190308 length:798 start_codon:yes stop_codon:yes gene_type:complete